MINCRATRGFLNNNPGNMDRSADNWQGEIKDPDDKRLTGFQLHELVAGRFCVFVAPEWGIRAMAKNLFAYADRLGLRTVRAFIGKWAPPEENDTAAYIASVARAIGVSADEPVNIRDYKTLRAVVDAIIRVECGGMPYASSELEDGLRLAGVVKPVGVTTSKTATAGTVASTATVGTAALSTLQDPIQQAADTLSPLAGTTETVDHILLGLKLLLAAVALAGVGVMVWERVKRSKRDEIIEGGDVPAGA